MEKLLNALTRFTQEKFADIKNYKLSGKKTLLRIVLPIALVMPTSAIVAVPAWACDTAPSTVSSTTANGTYGAGSVINVNVTWGTNLAQVSGAPYISLDLGAGKDRRATYTGLDGSRTMNFSYTVQAGDQSLDLQYVSTASLVANGATMKYSGCNYTFRTNLPALTGSSLGTNKAIVINGGAALATVSTLTGLTAFENNEAGDVITATPVSLSPAFASGTTLYTATLRNNQSGIWVNATWTGTGETASVIASQLSQRALTSGTSLGKIPVPVGVSDILVTGYAQNGTTTSYTIRATRAAATDNQITGLALSNGLRLSPTFDSATATYSVAAANETSTVNVTPTWVGVGETATATFGGSTYALTSGSQLATAMNLSVGANTLVITGHAQNGTTRTYTVTITRAPSSVSTLSALSLNNGLVLSPSFAAATTTYSVAAANETSTVNITPTWVGVGETATATFGGSTYALTSGSQLATAMSLNVGANTLTIRGFAASGATTTYTITITRAASSVSTLSALSLNNGLVLSPSFAAATTTYSVAAANETSTVNITPTWIGVGETATATFNSSTYALTSGSQLSTAMSLALGANTLTIKGYAASGATTTYTTTITRAASSVSTLSGLTLNNGLSLSPSFASATTTYTVAASAETSTVRFTPTWIGVGETATANFNGVTYALASGVLFDMPVNLGFGTTALTIKGYAASGAITTYTITFTRPTSSISTLSALSLSNSLSLSPSFASATTSYTVAAPNTTSSFRFTPTWSPQTGETVTATIGGTLYALTDFDSGNEYSTAVPLNYGANILYIDGYASDGSRTRYTITINRALATVSTLTALTFTNSSITLAPSFAAGTTTYEMTVPFTTSSTQVTGTWVGVGETATVTFNGSTYALTSGTTLGTAIALTAGAANIVTVKGFAQDGSTTTYTVTITRTAAETIRTLSGLTFTDTNITLAPTFVSSTTVYTMNSLFTTTSTKITASWTGSFETATVTFGGTTYALANGTLLATAIPLSVGDNTILVTCYAQNGLRTTYDITIRRTAIETVSTLSRLTFTNSSISLSPTFAASTTSYAMTVPATTSTTQITADWLGTFETGTATFGGATYTLRGGTILATAIPLSVGANTITVRGFAQNGTSTTYTVTITRESLNLSTPAAPTLTAVSESTTAMSVNYTASQVSNTSVYRIALYVASNDSLTATVQETYTAGVLVFSGLTPNTGYYAKVTAIGSGVYVNSAAGTSSATVSTNALPVTPTITTQPGSVTITSGTTTSFSVVTSRTDGGTLSYQWQVAPSVTGTFANVSGGSVSSSNTGSTYTTPTLTVTDNLKAYRVLVYNTKNGATTASAVTSDSATATVRTITLSTPAAPTLSAVSGSTTSISVNYSASQVSNTSVYSIALYLASNNSLFSTVQETFTTGVIVFSGLAPNTWYYARVSAIGSGNYGNSAAGLVGVEVPTNALPVAPTISTQPGSVSITSGNTTSFSVVTSRSDGGTLSYQWQVASSVTGSFENVTDGSPSSSNTGSTYTTPALTVSDTGKAYRVLVYNTKNGATTASPVTSDSATVTVSAITLSTPAAPTLTAVSESTTAMSVNYSASQVSNTSTYSIALYLASNNSLISTVQQSYSSGVVIFSGLTPNTGYYAKVTAIGSGNYGNSAAGTSSTTVLTNALPVAPTISTQPGSVTITSGNTTSFSVVTSRTDGGTLSYQWQVAPSVTGTFADVVGGSVSSSNTGSTYTTPALNVANNLQAYRVLVYNTKNGATTASAVTSDSATVNVSAITLSTPAAPGWATPAAVSGSTTAITVNYASSQVSNTTVYRITLYLASNDSLTATVQETYGTGLITFSGLAPNTGYYAKVTAIGSGNYGNSALSSASTTVLTNALPVDPSITTQPGSVSITSGNATSFSVVTTRSDGGTLTYQWQVAPSVTGTFANVSGGSTSSSNTGSTYTTPALTVLNNDSGKAYRVLVYNTRNGATTAVAVTSDSATATISGITLSTPARPTLTAVSESTTAISVNYSASQVSNTSVYRITLYLASDNSEISSVQQTYSNGVLVFSGLTPNTGYYAKVTGIGSGNYGNSAAGASSTTVSTNALPVSPTISVQPGSVSITSGNTTSFSVTTARTDGGTLTYQWQVAPSVTGTFENVSGGSTSSSNTGSTYTTPALTVANTGRAYRVLVYNTRNGATTASAVTSDSATVTVGAILLSTPSAPTLSAVIESTTEINVDWSASQVSNTTVYNIALYLHSNNSLISSVQRTYTDPSISGRSRFTGLIPNTRYYAKVTAVGSGNYRDSAEGVASSPVFTNALPVTPSIDSPGSTTITSGNTTSFSIGASRSDGGTLSYQWQVAASSGGTFANVSDGSVSSSNTGSTYTTPTLTIADTGKAYRVLVYNSKNGAITTAVTSNSADVTVGTITLSTPAAPTLTAVSGSTTSMSVNYAASQVSNTTVYRITLYLASNDSLTATVQESYSTGRITFSGLTPNTGYYAKVTGIGSGNYGNSAAGTSSTTVSTNALPVTPTITTQPGSVTITSGNTTSFSVVTSRTDGGTLSYQWQVAASVTGTFANVTDGSVSSSNAGSTYTTAALTVADNGEAFRVLVYNTKNGATTAVAVTSDSATATVGAITLSTPAAPTLTAVSGSTTSISVNYSASQVSNTSVYSIALYLASNDSLTATVQQSYTSGAVTFSGLTPNTGYYAKVTAIGSGNYGNSAASSASTTVSTNALPVSATISTQPGSVTITAGNTTSFSVVTARTDGGTLSYQWQVAPSVTGTFADVVGGSVSSSNTGSTYTTPALNVANNLQAYRILVYNTKNGATTASPVISDSATATIAAIKLTKPSAPSGSAVAGSATSATITYTSVSNASIYAIKVYRSSDNYLAYDANNTFTTGTVAITGLASGTTYYATITANGSGNYSTSDASNSSTTFRTNSALTAPTLSGSATSGTLKSIDLTWGSATANATGYLVRIYNSAGTSLLESITVSSATTISQSITATQYSSIADGTTYKFAIVALGTGEYLSSSESEMISISTNSAAGSITFSAQPQAASKSALQSAEFSVSASGDGSLTYQWQVSSDAGATWSNVSSGTGATTSSYTTASLNRSSNENRYRVAVTNTKNGSTSTAYSDDVLLSVAFINQAPLVISTLQGRTEVALTLRATGGSSGEAISYATSSEGCSIVGAVLTRTTVGYCVVQATRAGNATVYNAVSSVASSIRFLLGDGNVDLTFDDRDVLEFEYQAGVRIVVAVVESGKVQILQDGRPVPGCTTLKATPTAPAVCNWKPSSLGYPKVTAILTPNNTANPPRGSAIYVVRVNPRS